MLAETKQEEKQTEKKATAIEVITKYLDADMVKARFSEIVGKGNAGAYISSVITAAASSEALQKCTPTSIYVSAVRAATMRLSVDPSLGQAYLVPFKGAATLVVGYKGLYDMAVRTGKYRYINVGPIYEGQDVEENQMTGFHSIVGQKKGDKIIGWIGAFELFTGYGKTFYMTTEEIHEHAKEYSASYKTPGGVWQKETKKMERKTVMRLMIRRWALLDPADLKALDELEHKDPETIDADSEYIYSVPGYDENETEHKRTTEENLQQLGFGS